jgi:hypothetical protein
MSFTRAHQSLAATTRLLLMLFIPMDVVAQDLEPRTYSNLPIGQNFLVAAYGHSEGEIAPSPSVPIKDVELTVDGYAGGYARSIDMWGESGKIDVLWSRVCMKGEGTVNDVKIKGDRCGTSDPRVRLTYLFYGAPAMDLAQFKVTPVSRVIGVSFAVSAPLGDYNNENLINTGANRWTFKPEIGISNRRGDWSLEASFGARLFTDNDSFAGHTKLEQDPLYQLQGHVIYHLRQGRWLSLNGNYFWGGETQKNGSDSDDKQENSRVGVTLGWPLNKQHSLKFYASRGVVTNIGNDFDTFGAAWQYRWGD